MFCIKAQYYVMKIMEIWMKSYDLEGARTIRSFIDRSRTKGTKQFTYHYTFGINFRYRHQVDYHNNMRHATFSLKRTWSNKFWPDSNFAWYLAVLEVNTDLASGHFQNDGVVQPGMYFWRVLEI